MAHGQMAATQLEEVMTAFDDGQFNVLLATNIVESGLDVPNANTMIIHRSDLFGLAQLYQLRGRIGRSKVRGYAYLTYAPKTVLSATATQRLHVIETLDSLGAGFQLASHEWISGAPAICWVRSNPAISRKSASSFTSTCWRKRWRRRGVAPAPCPRSEDQWTPSINLGMPVLIPEAYIADLNVRLGLYRRISESGGPAGDR